MIRKCGIWLGLFGLCYTLLMTPAFAKDVGFSPTSVYSQEYIEGFSVFMNPVVLLQKSDAAAVRKELTRQLIAINRVVPEAALRDLRNTTIWVEWKQNDHSAAVFHLSAVWLNNNGFNPDKAGDIEISNTRNFVQWSQQDQPWMLLHELTHAYHHHVLGDDNAEIASAFHQAKANKLYDSVQHIGGSKKRAYAMTNAREYFAELSEAYFGFNDHYPFRRADLRRHDPTGFQLMEKIWGTLK
ncbi:MAG: hypothetical protein ACPG51_02055 [Thiolinea sp.]